MTTRRKARPAVLVAALLLGATPTFADTGIPMLVIVWPAAWALLIPVILLEAEVARRILKTTFRRSLVVSGAANLVSTFVGIPLTWLLLLAAEIVVGLGLNAAHAGAGPNWTTDLFNITVAAPWFLDKREWVVMAAAMWLCIPFYFASVWIEAKVAKRFVPAQSAGDVRLWSWRANLLSYSLIEALLVFVLLRLSWGGFGILDLRDTPDLKAAVLSTLPPGWSVANSHSFSTPAADTGVGNGVGPAMGFALVLTGPNDVFFVWKDHKGQSHRDPLAKEALEVWLTPASFHDNFWRGANEPKTAPPGDLILSGPSGRVYARPSHWIVARDRFEECLKDAEQTSWPESPGRGGVALSWDWKLSFRKRLGK